MPRTSGEIIELMLTGMAYGGEAFGRQASGRMVFVPFALAGERVRAEVIESHQSWARARLAEVLDPSPDRIEPRCRHFRACGGCHYQHAAYARQVEDKAAIVRSQLQRLGGLADPPISAGVPSPSPWNTRNHIQFHLTPDGALGFQPWGVSSSDEEFPVLPISECHLPEPPLNDLWPRLALDPESGIKRVALRLGAADEVMVTLQAAEPPSAEALVELPASVVWLDPSGVSVLAGADHLPFEVAGLNFRVSADSFFQVHTLLAGDLARHVVAQLEPNPGDHILDLYAGVGLFSAFLASAGARVTAVELSASACHDFRSNLDAFDGVGLYELSVEQALPELEGPFEAVVADPPRAGLGQFAIAELARLSPSRPGLCLLRPGDPCPGCPLPDVCRLHAARGQTLRSLSADVSYRNRLPLGTPLTRQAKARSCDLPEARHPHTNGEAGQGIARQCDTISRRAGRARVFGRSDTTWMSALPWRRS